MNSITRELAEERLVDLPYISTAAMEGILKALFPPPFIPKEDEVYAYTDTNGETKYVQHGQGHIVHGARPQTDREKGV